MRVRCEYCKWDDGKHNPHCPYQIILRDAEWVTKLIPAIRKLYHEGWDDGRAGKEEQQNDPTYRLGFCEGARALEEYENGYDPVWMS